jgi:hypothetical protein
MMVIVPVMFIVTLSMAFLFLAQTDQQDLAMYHTIANDFAMVHEWRAGQAELLNIRDGQMVEEPGYPFRPFYTYYTEVHETDTYIAVVTWPIEANGAVELPSENGNDMLASLEARLNRGVFSGNFVSFGPGEGGRLAGFDLVGMERQPENGIPMLTTIFSKD